jgi:HD-like signal output (HDOD) protein
MSTEHPPSGSAQQAKDRVQKRFRFAGLEHPVLQTLYDLAVEREIQGLSTPSGADEDHGLAYSSVSRSADSTAFSLAPLELLVSEIKLPALPQVLLELLRVVNDPGSSAADLAGVIRLDPSLSSYLLRIVNSAYYSFPFPIDTVQRAVVLIGTRELCTLAFSRSFLNIFGKSQSEALDIEAFWKHSIACGMIAAALAHETDKRNPDRHFVAGLLHDIGRLALFNNLPALGVEVLAVGREKDLLLYEAERTLLGFDHGRFGGSLLNKWNLPSTLSASISYHHAPDMADMYDETKTIHLADVVANALGIGSSGDGCVPTLEETVWEGLGLSTRALVELIGNVEAELGPKFEILLGVETFDRRSGPA